MESGTYTVAPPISANMFIVRLAALDLGFPQVDLVAAHDRDGVDFADRAEPTAPLGAAHDGDHPAHWLARPGDHHAYRRLLGQIAGQDGQFAARLGRERVPGSILEFSQGEPPDGGVVAEHLDRRVTLSASDTRRESSDSLTAGRPSAVHVSG